MLSLEETIMKTLIAATALAAGIATTASAQDYNITVTNNSDSIRPM